MNSPSAELEAILRQLIEEHQKLLRQLESQQSAMKRLDLRGLEELAGQQDATRVRIATLENRRRQIVNHLSLSLRIQGEPTISRIAEALPQSKARLLAMRDQLKTMVVKVSSRATVAGRLAGSVLGHLNTVVRLVAGVVEQAGLYTKHGVPRVSSRIGVIEAVG